MKTRLGSIAQKSMLRLLMGVAMTLLAAGTAFAGITTYSGWDSSSGYPAHPNSDLAAAQFDNAIGSFQLINFESAPLGTYTSLQLAPGITLSGIDSNHNNQRIVNSPDCSPLLCGYNITTGGSKWADVYGGSIKFTFNTPISAFGAYFTGVQVPGISVTFSDGSQQSLDIPVGDGQGGTAFLGFTDSAGNITSVTINGGYDIIGVDDVRIPGPGATTPEPASLALLGSGVLTIAGFLRKRLEAS